MRARDAISALAFAVVALPAVATAQPEPVDPTAVGYTHVLPTPIGSPHPVPTTTDPNTPVWTETIDLGSFVCPGCNEASPAQWVKLHFSRFELGVEDHVEVSDVGGQIVDRYDASEDGEFWALSVPGDTVVVELFADGRGEEFGIEIDQIGYGFPDGYALPSGLCDLVVVGKACGTPAPDNIVCHPNEHGASLPTARLVFGAGDLCWNAATGFLIDSAGRMLTNNHVVSTQIGVRTIEAQFFYESLICSNDIVPPSYFLTPLLRYRGLQLLATDFDCDYTLFQLTDGQVASLLFGFAEAADTDPAENDAVFLPQHPSARLKKFSDGPVTDPNLAVFGGERVCTFSGGALGALFGFDSSTGEGASGSPVHDLSDEEWVGIVHSSTGDGASCRPVATGIERVREGIPGYLQPESVEDDFLFEDRVGASLLDLGSAPGIDVGCLSFDYDQRISADWDASGRFSAEGRLAWDPDEARMSAGYYSCDIFTAYTEMRFFNDYREHELDVGIDGDVENEFTVSACIGSAEWDIDLSLRAGYAADFDPELGGLIPDPIRSGGGPYGGAELEVLGLSVLSFEADTRLSPSATVIGTSVQTTATIAGVSNPPLNGGVSFAPDDLAHAFDCDPSRDVTQTSVPVPQEAFVFPFDIYVKPCVIPGSTFTVRLDPQSYETIPYISILGGVDTFIDEVVRVNNAACPECILFAPSLWSVPAAASNQPLEFEVVVQQPGASCLGLQNAIDAYCVMFPSSPVCNIGSPSTEQHFDLALGGGRVGSLPPGSTLQDAVIFSDLDEDPGTPPEIAGENPSLDLGGVTPGQPALLSVYLRDVHGNAAEVPPPANATALTVELSLSTPGDPDGVPVDALSSQLDGQALAPGPTPNSVALPQIGALGDSTGLLQIEWDVPPPLDGAWDPTPHGKVSCTPSSYVRTAITNPQPGLGLEEFAGSNEAAHSFTPAFPDFSIVRIASLRDADSATYPDDEHRWLEEDRSMTFEVELADIRGDFPVSPSTEPVFLFMTVQFIDSDGLQPTLTDSNSPAPIPIPASALTAGASVARRFHYSAPPTASVPPSVYEEVVFTFTVNDPPACAVMPDVAPCDCPISGGIPACSCVTNPVTNTVSCGALPAAWGGGPAVLHPECGRARNTASVRVAYKGLSEWTLYGTAQGGTIAFTIEGVPLVVVTTAGQTSAQVAANVASAINADPTLSAAGITATSVGGTISTNGAISGAMINDPGLLGGGTGPALSEWGVLLVVLFGMIAATLAFRRPEGAHEPAGAGVPTGRRQAIPDPWLLGRLFVAAGILHAVACVAAYAYFGELAARDAIGGALTAGAVAYLLHLWLSAER